jgi:hypothetical protein
MKEAIQKEIVTWFDAAYKAQYPTIPVTYENQPFDWNNLPDTFVEFEVRFYSGQQINLGAPKTRHGGYIYVTVWTKEGKGTLETKRIIDWVAGRLGYKALATVQIEADEPDENSPTRGWHLEGVKFRFYADQT